MEKMPQLNKLNKFKIQSICRKLNKRKIQNICRQISKATYYIYLLQMFYFWSEISSVINRLNNKVIVITLNLLICILGGILFYTIYNKLVILISFRYKRITNRSTVNLKRA